LRTRIPVAICLTSVLLFRAASAAPDSLAVFLDGDYLRVSMPHLDFLKGRPLDRLKDGASVVFDGQVTLSTSPNSLFPVARAVARFAFSYDIWEERFSVTKIGQSPESRRSWSHLSAQAAENLCIENLLIDRSEIPANKPFYVQLDIRRAEDPKDQLGIIGDPGINVTRFLIEVFGRPPRSPQERLLVGSGPLRLSDLKKTEIKGIRG
jgi:hypothetical protein